MSSRVNYRIAVMWLSLLFTVLAVPVHAQSTGDNETLSPPENVVAQRYSDTAAEIFWERPETVGLRYEISRDGNFLTDTDGVSYFDQALSADSAPTYAIIAIDRQGLRSLPSSITVPAFGDPDPEPVDSLITLDSYESILKELIELINGTPLYHTMNTQPAITEAGITLVSVSSEPMEDEVFGLGFVYDYSCDAGGSIEEFRFTEPGSRQYTFEDCILESGIFNGVLKEFFVGREGSGVTATAYTVHAGDQTKMLSGRHESSIFRGIAGLNRCWQPTDLDVQSSESTLALSSYELEAISVYNPPNNVNDSDLRVSFDVTAAWTAEQRIHVEVSLQTSMEPDSAFTWQTGEVVAVADDGSQMTLTPADASQRTFNIALSENDSLLTRQWSDGFEIHCAFADIDACGSF